MKKILPLVGALSLCLIPLFSETTANDTQAAIVNGLLIQQLMQMQQQNNQQQPQETKPKRIEDENDLIAAGYKKFAMDEDSEDNLVLKTSTGMEYEVDIWAIGKRNDLTYIGSVFCKGKKGYKGNPFGKDLDNFKAVWLKVLNDDKAVIKNLGEHWSDQHFEIQ